MDRLAIISVRFILILALSLTFVVVAVAQQPAAPKPKPASPAQVPAPAAAPTAAAAASATPAGVAIQAIPELDETQSGTFLPDPEYVSRFSQADPSLRMIEARRVETEFTTFDPVAALRQELQTRKQSIDSLNLQMQNESFYTLHPPLEPRRLRNVPLPTERRNF